MSVAQRMREKLESAFQPESLDIIDDSHRHAGHAGHDGRGESHFRVKIVSSAFAGHSRIDIHRMIHHVLAEELADRVHALVIQASAPD